jgi:transketolase
VERQEDAHCIWLNKIKEEKMEFDREKNANRSNSLRKSVLDLALEQGEAHLGGSFSEIEILVSLYDYILKPEDKFILSKGHACLPWYLLLQENGYDPKIQTHPDIDEQNGIYATTGSLGHGLPIGIGRAMAMKRLGKPGRVYVLMSDGECEEGTTWESALIAAHHKVDNLTVVIDRNYIQALDFTEKVLSLGDLGEKFKIFRWETSIVNGHLFEELVPALKKIGYEKPYVVIANTVKGKGVSYMENNPDWHAKKVTLERIKPAYEELK